MDGHTTNERDALLALLRDTERKLASTEKQNEALRKSVQSKSLKIDTLEERLRALLTRQFGKSSERFNPDQLSFFNEAEVTAASEPEELDEGDEGIDVKPRKNARKPIPNHLPRIDITHELEESERQCSCGLTLQRIGEDVAEQLSIVPRQHFVERHIRARYACSCRSAP